jgi:hypothetical protein
MSSTDSLLHSLYVMASMVEARDPYTGGHLWRVSQFSGLLADALGLPSPDRGRIVLGGFLHDLGKVGVPDAILNKPDRLTEDEYAVIRTHPHVGSRILTNHPFEPLVVSAILSHHEMPSGKGYPHGLMAGQISVDARIVGLCDAFDAMTSTRPYRQGMSIAKALDIIGENLGRQFDADFGRQFIEIGQKGTLDSIVGHSDIGMPLQHCPTCGPTIVIKRDGAPTGRAFCRSCGYEASVRMNLGQIEITPTGTKGAPADLEPDIDTTLIAELVAAYAPLVARASPPPEI